MSWLFVLDISVGVLSEIFDIDIVYHFLCIVTFILIVEVQFLVYVECKLQRFIVTDLNVDTVHQHTHTHMHARVVFHAVEKAAT